MPGMATAPNDAQSASGAVRGPFRGTPRSCEYMGSRRAFRSWRSCAPAALRMSRGAEHRDAQGGSRPRSGRREPTGGAP